MAKNAKRPTIRRRGAGARASFALHDAFVLGVEAAAREVPTTWLDPLLTGSCAALEGPGPWGCPDIQRLLQGVAAKIRALAAPSKRRASASGRGGA